MNDVEYESFHSSHQLPGLVYCRVFVYEAKTYTLDDYLGQRFTLFFNKIPARIALESLSEKHHDFK